MLFYHYIIHLCNLSFHDIFNNGKEPRRQQAMLANLHWDTANCKSKLIWSVFKRMRRTEQHIFK